MSKSLFTARHDRLRDLLVEARRNAGLRQVDVAVALGRPQSFVSKYENGERRLDVVEFVDVTHAIGIRADEILRELQPSQAGRRKRKRGGTPPKSTD